MLQAAAPAPTRARDPALLHSVVAGVRPLDVRAPLRGEAPASVAPATTRDAQRPLGVLADPLRCDAPAVGVHLETTVTAPARGLDAEPRLRVHAGCNISDQCCRRPWFQAGRSTPTGASYAELGLRVAAEEAGRDLVAPRILGQAVLAAPASARLVQVRLCLVADQGPRDVVAGCVLPEANLAAPSGGLDAEPRLRVLAYRAVRDR
mmetsp:Transcript_31550/g.90550  ORF Transcript_31550/g.90550 Transcript_31550/m.90550 type:complete len:206 (+) Transcript_31550:343-960(+)